MLIKLLGNLGYEASSFHGSFGLPLQSGDGLQSISFRDAAGTVHARGAIGVVMSMAAVKLRVLTDEAYVPQVQADFELEKTFRCSSSHLQES